jgi:hypothetical protein
LTAEVVESLLDLTAEEVILDDTSLSWFGNFGYEGSRQPAKKILCSEQSLPDCLSLKFATSTMAQVMEPTCNH